ncbi:tyrosine phosphatase family protein [Rhizosaccharibacter radicis]|uniref:Protein-tyrosine-phosphatase n=1 Tax=Rhizosaccharibacter radicis TaxID=2782605 RepID=A0ABT1VV35_9PROT|nr:protein-tyrosine-phosphatase [Acetobacteraceae bacterium KSS12]
MMRADGIPAGPESGCVFDGTFPFAIAICGLDELAGHGGAGATHVLSILDPDRAVPDAFTGFRTHRRLELRFHDVVEPLDAMVPPDDAHIRALLAFGRDMRASERAPLLLVHCHAGISRSTAAMALMLADAMPEEDAHRVLRRVHAVREKAWPNLRMMELGDALLGRRGTLVAATHALHRLQLDRRPHVAPLMERDGRGREVRGAVRSAPLVPAPGR